MHQSLFIFLAKISGYVIYEDNKQRPLDQQGQQVISNDTNRLLVFDWLLLMIFFLWLCFWLVCYCACFCLINIEWLFFMIVLDWVLIVFYDCFFIEFFYCHWWLWLIVMLIVFDNCFWLCFDDFFWLCVWLIVFDCIWWLSLMVVPDWVFYCL